MARRHTFDWMTLVYGIVGLACAVGATAFLVSSEDKPTRERGLEVQAQWPERLSRTAETRLPVRLRHPDGEPIEEASVTLGWVDRQQASGLSIAEQYWHGTGYHRLTTTETDASGRALVGIPSVDELPGQTDAPAGRDLNFILTTRSSWQQQTESVTYPVPGRARVSLRTDRPLYQPGQQIHLRGLLFDRDNGGPLADASGQQGAAVELNLTDPRGNVLYRQTLSVNPQGVVSETIPIAADAPTGDYRATLTYHEQSTTQTVTVKPYQKPRFDVSLSTETDTGDERVVVSGGVSADYIYGEPVDGADVTLRFDASGLPEEEATKAEAAASPFSAALDGRGRADFRMPLPDSKFIQMHEPDWRLEAVVTDDSGRTQTASATVTEPTGRWQIEVFPTDATRFREGESHQGRLLVRDESGAAVEGVRFALETTGSEGTLVAQGETDDRGRADFRWKPSSVEGWSTDLVATVVPADGRPDEQPVAVPTASQADLLVTPQTPTPRAGQTLSFRFETTDVPGSGGDWMVAAVHDGMVVAGTTVDASSKTGDATGEIELGRSARGLTHLVVLNNESYLTGYTTLWVRGRGAGRVDFELPDGPQRPGESTELSVSLDGASNHPVTYGIWAVDEALLSLKQRSHLPLNVLLRQNAEAAKRAAELLARIDAEASADATTRAGRANAALLNGHAQSLPATRLGDASTTQLDEDLQRLERRPWLIGWLLLLTFGLIGLLFASTLHLRRVSGSRGWYWTPPLQNIVGLAGVLYGTIALAAVADLSPGGSLTVYAIIACLLLVSGLVETVLRARQLEFWKWLGAIALIGGLSILIAQTLDALETVDFMPVWASMIFGGISLIAAATILLQTLGWQIVLHRRECYLAKWSLILCVCAPFMVIVAASSFGTTVETKFEHANRGVQDFVAFDEQGTGESSAPVSSESAAPAGAEAGGADGPTVRQHFPDTMLWRPSLTAEDGTAEFAVELPDSITTWRLHAIGHTADGNIGEGSARLPVRKPLFAEVDLPSHLTAGDRLSVPVSIVDGRLEPEGELQVEVAAEAGGALRLAGAIATEATVEPGGRTGLTVPVAATSNGEGSLTVRVEPTTTGAAARLKGDAVRRQTVVRADGRRRSLVESGLIGEGWTGEITVPDSALAGTIAGRLDLLPGRTAVALEGVEAMLSQPRGCFEQTTSSAYPNLMILEALNGSSPEEWSGGADEWNRLRRRSRLLVREGYQKILTFQKPDGGFALYPGDISTTRLTAYGLLQTAAIDAAISDIDATRPVKLASKWLIQSQESDGSWPADGQADALLQTTLTVWALAEGPEDTDEEVSRALEMGVDYIEAQVDGQSASTYHRALAANALLAARRDKPAASLLDRLVDASIKGDGSVHWEGGARTMMGGFNDSSDIVTTALVARALAETDREPVLFNRALDYLARMRGPKGGWASTEATVWAIDAFARLNGSGDQPVRITTTVDGEPLDQPGNSSDGQVRLIPGRSAAKTLRAPDLSTGAHIFRASLDGETGAIGQATVDYVVPWSSPAANLDNGIYSVDIDIGEDEVAPGEPVAVEIDVTNTSDVETSASILRLPVPPGAWPDTENLESMRDAGKLSRIERTPTHLVIYLDGISPSQTANFRYTVVPRIGGDYRFPAVEAWRYYNPTPRAATAGPRLTVASGDQRD